MLLISKGVVPYYVHQLDRVKGALHFEVDPRKGRAFMEHLSRRLPGYGVPKYVQEIGGKPYKMEVYRETIM